EISSSSIASQFIKYGLSAKNQFARDILPDLKEMPFPVFPAQLISFLANMVIFLFLWIFVRKRYKKDGSVFGIWMIMYGIFRFIIEIFRADDRGLFFNDLFSSSQIIAIISVIAGIFIIMFPDKEEKSVSHSQS
ncbi:MAG TPA: prolipoprotein diacylglyceryl transferase family protein, partial [bacterium]|nr:prolipoprotein diacylglyceryl transferase family protein [bacterium]